MGRCFGCSCFGCHRPVRLTKPNRRRPRHICPIGALRVEVEPVPVSGDRLDRDRAGRGACENLAVAGGELPRAYSCGGEILRHLLQPHDRMRTRVRRSRELNRAGEIRGQVPGVDEEIADSCGSEQPTADLGGAEFAPTLKVVLRRRVRREVDQRRAPPAQAQAELAVEKTGAGWSRVARLGDQELEITLVEVGPHDPVPTMSERCGRAVTCWKSMTSSKDISSAKYSWT